MAMMLSGVMMLCYLGQKDSGDRSKKVIAGVIVEGKSYGLKPAPVITLLSA